MPPRMEGIRHLPEEYAIGGPTGYFTVPLDGPRMDTIDAMAFDTKLASLGGKFSAKFVVAQDNMYIFHPRRAHANFYDDLKKAEDIDQLELQCAGFMKLHSDWGGVHTRDVYGYSETLEASGLTQEQSDKYKVEVLRRKLGSAFNVR